jgi:metal-dependent hydrolase (beta-lactamase superfamily II)
LWQKRAPADDKNRITLAMRPLLVRSAAGLMLIDAGIGDKMDEKSTTIYGIDRSRNLDHALADAGLTADSIQLVLASHLHFDHAGGFTTRMRMERFGRGFATRDMSRGRRNGRMRPIPMNGTARAIFRRTLSR